MNDMVTQRLLDEARAEIDKLRTQTAATNALVLSARNHLRNVLEMTVDSEDQMIMIKVRDAHDLLQTVINVSWGPR